MNIRDRRAVHSQARQALASAPGNPRQVALAYAGITALVALLITILTALLTDRIANTGGLGNMGLRSILSTGQTILPILQTLISLALSFGYHRAILRMTRGHEAHPRDLAEGFQYFGAVLRTAIFQGLIYMVSAFGTMYLSAYIYLLTPMSEEFRAIMEPVMASVSSLNSQVTIDAAVMESAMVSMLPMFGIWVIAMLLLFVPVYYNYRMTSFCLADDPRHGAMLALHRSKLIMRRNRFALLKLDLSLWWFYLLQLLISFICYGDVACSLLGIALPWSGEFAYYFFFVLSVILQIVTYYFLMNRVYVTYAVAYESLRQPFQPQSQETQVTDPTEE